MAISAPLKITLYDPETSEVRKEYVRSFIPWRMLKKAVQLSKTLTKVDQENITDEQLDEVASLVVSVFGDQFTVEELNDGADLTEMMTVIQGIMAKEHGFNPNPPPPGKK